MADAMFGMLQAEKARAGGGPGFPSLEAMQADAQGQRARCSEVDAAPRSVLFVAEGSSLGLEAPGLQVGSMTPWALRQVGTLCGVPAAVVDRLQPATAARVLNETWEREGDPQRFLLERPADGSEGSTLRAVTSTGYRRVWDADVLGEVSRWLAPTGWTPGRPTLKGYSDSPERTLYRTDRDSFAFFMSERDGSRPGPEAMRNQFDDDGLGGMRRMIFVGNSETGARSFMWGNGWFRGICCNLGLWGAEDVSIRRKRHTAGVMGEVRDLRTFIRDTVPTVADADLEPFRILAGRSFDVPPERTAGKGWAERAADVLVSRFGVTRAASKAAAVFAERGDAGAKAGTWWAIVNGLTGPASVDLTAGDRFDLSAQSGKVVAAGLQAAGV